MLKDFVGCKELYFWGCDVNTISKKEGVKL